MLAEKQNETVDTNKHIGELLSTSLIKLSTWVIINLHSAFNFECVFQDICLL